jgi:hypothetical protein
VILGWLRPFGLSRLRANPACEQSATDSKTAQAVRDRTNESASSSHYHHHDHHHQQQHPQQQQQSIITNKRLADYLGGGRRNESGHDC